MVTKEWGERTRETIFPETPIVRVKNVGKKIVAKNCEKKRFLYSHEYLDQQMVEKTRETIFPETHEWCEQKMF